MSNAVKLARKFTEKICMQENYQMNIHKESISESFKPPLIFFLSLQRYCELAKLAILQNKNARTSYASSFMILNIKINLKQLPFTLTNSTTQ